MMSFNNIRLSNPYLNLNSQSKLKKVHSVHQEDDKNPPNSIPDRSEKGNISLLSQMITSKMNRNSDQSALMNDLSIF